MSVDRRPAWAAYVLVVALLALTLAGQAMADSMISPSERSNTAKTVGQAGFSYLSGLRTFGAAVLWNRMEPLLHSYYQGTSLADRRFVLPTVQIVIALDPTLYEPYYVGSWIIARNDHVDEGLELARRGMEANPESGVLRSAYAQMIFILKDDPEGALPFAEGVLDPDTYWRSLDEQFQGYSVARDVYQVLGRTEDAARVSTEMDHVSALIDSGADVTEHDHDHEE
ncbi:MAG: tetratricopeptide repeat protein [Coriobacteriia bacterium]